jgi:hypothetical protein
MMVEAGAEPKIEDRGAASIKGGHIFINELINTKN